MAKTYECLYCANLFQSSENWRGIDYCSVECAEADEKESVIVQELNNQLDSIIANDPVTASLGNFRLKILNSKDELK